MRSRTALMVAFGLAWLVGCSGTAVADPEPTGVAVPMITLTDLDSIETFSTVPPTAPPTTLPEPPEVVAVIGDSLTVASADELDDRLAQIGVTSVTIDAVEGRRINHRATGTSSGVAAARELAAQDPPDVWVIALGTNDVPGFGHDGFRGDIESLLDELPRNARVIWVDTWIRSRADEAAEANQLLREVLADRPRTTVLDWFELGDEPGLVVSDGIHLTATGEQRYAELIADAVARAGA